jgi:biopolymer transport protein ExbB
MKKRWILMAAITCLAALAADAQTNSAFAQVAQAVSTRDMSMKEIFDKGGMLMYFLSALSVIGLAFIIYFIIILRREQLMPARFVAGLTALLREGKLTEARAACHANSSAIATVMEAALDYAIRSGGKPDSGMLREVIEGEGARQATLMQNQTQYLNDIAVIAPMIGLLGTVWGMLKAFNVVALDMARAKPLELAGGVSLSLITTCAGLIVAIPAMAGYFLFRNRAAKLVAELEVVNAKLVLEIERR